VGRWHALCFWCDPVPVFVAVSGSHVCWLSLNNMGSPGVVGWGGVVQFAGWSTLGWYGSAFGSQYWQATWWFGRCAIPKSVAAGYGCGGWVLRVSYCFLPGIVMFGALGCAGVYFGLGHSYAL
jgi:hypothetical protein